MCGISGFWLSQHNNSFNFEENLKRMNNSLQHRGPDNSDIWFNENFGIGLAHSRLSIIDLSDNGKQPIVSRSGRYVLTFNGEIYNHKKLRNEVNSYRQNPFGWRGTSDTETLIEYIETFGIRKALENSLGMFAFALWDKKSKKLTLVRDRFGEKPLYWGLLNNNLYNSMPMIIFASELPAIWTLKGITPTINNEAMNSYFTHGYVVQPLSIQKNISQLEPGGIVVISAKDDGYAPNKLPNEEKWWDIFLENKRANVNTELNPIDRIEKRLVDAIITQSSADVPICSFLSGGIDSSLITAILQKNSPKKISTFTIGFPTEKSSEIGFDESKYAGMIAKYLGTNHNTINLTSKDVSAIIPTITDSYSEPFSDSSQIPTLLISKIISDYGFKIAITGDGGDELFGGYNRHLYVPLMIKNLGFLPFKIRLLISKIINQLNSSNNLIKQEKLNKISEIIKNCDSIENAYSVLTKNRNNYFNLDLKKEYSYQFLNNYDYLTNTEKLIIKDLLFYLPNDILVKTDRASMAFGLETRIPFLDKNLVLDALNIPVSMKIRGTTGKLILKKILNRYIPNELHNRPKQGFTPPLSSWLSSSLKDWANDLINSDNLRSNEYLNYRLIKDDWNTYLSGKPGYLNNIWCVLIWQSWYNSWINNRTS